MLRLGCNCVLVVLCLAGCGGSSRQVAENPSQVEPRQVIERYAELVYETYREAHAAAAQMDRAIETFISTPTEANLAAAKAAWHKARKPYGESEAFRFYEGPIDAPPGNGGDEGPEGRLNAWPLNEAYIDYVEGDPEAGIINRGLVPITTHELTRRNAVEDEADVTTGYHAIEFLLWGQDLNADGPGGRPLSDYIGDSPAVQRRREYLRVVSDLLVRDLHGLVEEWKPDAGNYRALFLAMDENEALGKILTGLATLSGFELASERIGVPLDSSSQEDEQSCFSDSTHDDYLANARGIEAVYSRTGLDRLVKRATLGLDQKIENNVNQTLAALAAVDPPIDLILASKKGSAGRQKLERVVTLLQEQSRLFVEAGEKLGVEVVVAAE